MAIESISIKVAPNEEQYMINAYQKFGWQLHSSQEIYSRTMGNEISEEKITSVTETTNYIKLVFSRDKNMPNYEQIVALEKEFHAVQMPKKKSDDLCFWGKVSAFVAVVFIAIILINKLINKIGGGIPLSKNTCWKFAGVFAILSVILFIIGNKKDKIYLAEYNVAFQIAREKQNRILETVEQYL